MKIIFLDIDGVLNSHNFYKKTQEFEYTMFCPIAVANLNRIIKETGAKIVLTSTWRVSYGLKETTKIFKRNKVIGTILDKTPILHFIGDVKYPVPRGCEIACWLHNRDYIKNYVIIDDDSSMLLEHKNHFFKTSVLTGLTEKTANRIIKYL